MALLDALRHDAVWVHSSAAEALGKLGVGGEAVITALLASLRDDADARVRGSAAEALGKIAVLYSHQVTNGPASQPRQATEAQKTLRLIIGGLQQDASQQGSNEAIEVLWQLLWQLPPQMKAECLQELRAPARRL